MSRAKDEESTGNRSFVCGRSALLDLLVLNSQGKAARCSGGARPSGDGIWGPGEKVSAESLESSQTSSELPGACSCAQAGSLQP